jgi:CheY-like chemotaxis protein
MPIMATVLLVEDHADSSALIALLLRKRSHSVHAAANGEEALKLLMNGITPDVVLLDLQMPVMDGLSFLDNFRAFVQFQHVPVVVISASSTYSVSELLAYGVTAVLTKAKVNLIALADSIDRLDRVRMRSIPMPIAQPLQPMVSLPA